MSGFNVNDILSQFDQPEYDVEIGFEQQAKRWVRGPGCWVRDKPQLEEPCKTVLDGGTEVLCVQDTNDDYDGIERVRICKPVSGWVARNMISPSKTTKSARPGTRPRILCLHGARSSGKLFERQCAHFKSKLNADLFFFDAPFRNKGAPDPRCKPFADSLEGDESGFKSEPNFSWWQGTQAVVAHETFQHVFDALNDFECDAIMGFSMGAAVACQMPKHCEGLRFTILIGAVGERSLQFFDANCPSFHILDKNSTWGRMSERMAYNWKVKTMALHDEGDKIPNDLKPYKKLNHFMDEFRGGYERRIEEFA